MMATAAQVRMIHVAVTQLGLADEEYRALLQSEAGVTSSKDLSNTGVNRVLKRFAKLGFNNTAHRPRRYAPKGLITPEQQSMIKQQYEQLGWAEFARQMGFNKRCCGKAMPQTRGDAIKVIEGQKAILGRRAAEGHE
jgi:phage gp16-like protein